MSCFKNQTNVREYIPWRQINFTNYPRQMAFAKLYNLTFFWFPVIHCVQEFITQYSFWQFESMYPLGSHNSDLRHPVGKKGVLFCFLPNIKQLYSLVVKDNLFHRISQHCNSCLVLNSVPAVGLTDHVAKQQHMEQCCC